MKIENLSLKWSYKLDGIRVGRIRTAYDPVKTRLLEMEAHVEEPANCKAQSQTLSLVYSSASACDSDNAEFSLDCK